MGRKTAVWKILWKIGLLVFFGIGLCYGYFFNLFPQKKYKAQDFNLKTEHSSIDYNKNGMDDYTDFLAGAKKDAAKHPHYDARYWENGFPPEDIGVCTDTVWRAFREAGYDLSLMMDKDIERSLESYPHVEHRDKNIDFRRVKNLRIFFERYGVKLTTDIDDIEAWQPGDIVIFGKDDHIGIVSDFRNDKGHVFLIHNAGQYNRDEDYFKRRKPVAHYRFDASKVPEEVLVPWI